MSANSWMQTPAGYQIIAGKYVVTSWLQAIFNPSFFIRFMHMVLASIVTTCFVVAGVAAWYLLRNRHSAIAKPCFSFALLAAAIFTFIQIVIGDMVGLKVQEFQPLKTAAIEANWKTQAGAPLYLFAIPNVKQAKNLFPISIPYGASLLNTHQLQGVLKGLDSVSPNYWPLIEPAFFGFRVMVGIGFLLFFISLYGSWLYWRKKLYTSRLFQKICVWISPLGFVAIISGWITAETGRQPWIIYNQMRTAEGASVVPPSHVLISLLLFMTVYAIIFAFYLYYLFKFIRKGPTELEKIPPVITYLPVQPKARKTQ
jgi:cytochrome d ubiquinol oxidase subunit I